MGKTMNFKIISPKEIAIYQKQPGTILIDLRDKEDYDTGHIPGAVHIYYEELSEHYDYLRQFEQIILYCDRGNQSMIAARDLSRLGMKPIEVYGGMQAYQDALSRSQLGIPPIKKT